MGEQPPPTIAILNRSFTRRSPRRAFNGHGSSALGGVGQALSAAGMASPGPGHPWERLQVGGICVFNEKILINGYLVN